MYIISSYFEGSVIAVNWSSFFGRKGLHVPFGNKSFATEGTRVMEKAKLQNATQGRYHYAHPAFIDRAERNPENPTKIKYIGQPPMVQVQNNIPASLCIQPLIYRVTQKDLKIMYQQSLTSSCQKVGMILSQSQDLFNIAIQNLLK